MWNNHVWLMLLMWLTVAITQCLATCPCVVTQDCPEPPYGRHPLDLLHLGSLGPCENYGEVRCCSRKNFEESYKKYDKNAKDFFGKLPREAPSSSAIIPDLDCVCLPRGICQQGDVHYDPKCTGVFEKCCQPKGGQNHSIAAPGLPQGSSEEVLLDRDSPAPVFVPTDVALESPEDENSGPVKCINEEQCLRAYGKDVLDILHHGVISPCRKHGQVRCLVQKPDKGYSTPTSPDEQEDRKQFFKGDDDHVGMTGETDTGLDIVGQLEAIGIKVEPPGFRVDENGTLVISGGSHIVFLNPGESVPAGDGSGTVTKIKLEDEEANDSTIDNGSHPSDIAIAKEHALEDAKTAITTVNTSSDKGVAIIAIPDAVPSEKDRKNLEIIIPGGIAEDLIRNKTANEGGGDKKNESPPGVGNNMMAEANKKFPQEETVIVNAMVQSLRSLIELLLSASNTNVVISNDKNVSKNFTISREEALSLVKLLSKLK